MSFADQVGLNFLKCVHRPAYCHFCNLNRISVYARPEVVSISSIRRPNNIGALVTRKVQLPLFSLLGLKLTTRKKQWLTLLTSVDRVSTTFLRQDWQLRCTCAFKR